MILVDTSVWIEWLSGRHKAPVGDELLDVATCGPILQELVQGLRPGPASDALRDSLLALPRLSDPMPLELFLEGAEIYREGQKRGLTIRSSVDCLIAAVAIAHRVPVWHRDRDFDRIARFTRLNVVPHR